MPKWLDVGTQLINLEYIQKFTIQEVTKDRKGQVYIEKVILKAKLTDGDEISIAAFKTKNDAITWIRTKLRNSEEKIIQIK